MKLPHLQYGDLQARSEHGTAMVGDIARSIFARDPKCAPGDDSGLCQKPTDATSTQTLPIVLGVVIPISCAVVVFAFLHRRNKKRQAIEDLNDPHKSLDFGFDLKEPPRALKQKGRKRGAPEMIVTDMDTGSMRNHKPGLSFDMLESPYIMPEPLNGSRDSLHSMSRSIRDQNDPYRSVVFARNSTDTQRTGHQFRENGSIYSGTTMPYGYNDKINLVGNAQRMSQSRSYSLTGPEILAPRPMTPRSETPSGTRGQYAINRKELPGTSEPVAPNISAIKYELPSIPSPSPRATPEDEGEDLPSFPFQATLATKELPSPPEEPTSAGTQVPRGDSIGKGLDFGMDGTHWSDSGFYAEEEPPPAPPKYLEEERTPKTTNYVEDRAPQMPSYVEEPEDMGYDIDPSLIYTGRFSIDNSAPSHQLSVQANRISNNRLSQMGVRPLPPDNPEEHPEQRANRIRSFYKEYFDVNKPNPTNVYYEDYDANYADNYAFDWYDPEADQYYVPPSAPWAQQPGRRAMTPPPRGPPRFDAHHDRHYSTYSTMSGGRGAFRGRAPQKKNLPPPKTLNSLPTPHLLKTDAALMNASDFAPPTSFRELQNGRRPDSPMGTARPFSPSVRPYSPLVSTYKGLNPIPSPFELRKSGTFTSLDFSPQAPRFRGFDGPGSRAGSDAGSIRSARSGISALQMDAVRAGAYRVSRIPKEFVTSKDDMTNQLRPKWDLTAPA